jgi:hypothetical protein
MDNNKQSERLVNSILNSNDGNIVCLDKFLGDDIINILCEQIVNNNRLNIN